MTKRRNPKRSDPGTCRIFLTDRAVSDLVGIGRYSEATWGKRVASSYISKFEKAFKLLELNPHILTVNPALGESLLLYRVEQHVMACTRIEFGIAVLSVVHASRDIDTLLPQLAPTLQEEVKFLTRKIQNNK